VWHAVQSVSADLCAPLNVIVVCGYATGDHATDDSAWQSTHVAAASDIACATDELPELAELKSDIWQSWQSVVVVEIDAVFQRKVQFPVAAVWHDAQSCSNGLCAPLKLHTVWLCFVAGTKA
jgi:hypothetical protein